MTCIWTVFPQHNVVEEPNYWPEFMLLTAAGWISIYSLAIILQAAYWANIPYAKNWISLLYIYGITATTCILVHLSFNLIWIYILELFPPVPFTVYNASVIILFAMYTSLWFRYILSLLISF